MDKRRTSVYRVRFPMYTDHRGSLVAMQAESEVPFVIRRSFFIFDVGVGVSRGGHAHRQDRKVLVCLRGNCTIEVDDGAETEAYRLDDPCDGLYIHCGVWLVMKDFSDDCLLMVLCSTDFDPEDYISDYQEYICSSGKAEGAKAGGYGIS